MWRKALAWGLKHIYHNVHIAIKGIKYHNSKDCLRDWSKGFSVVSPLLHLFRPYIKYWLRYVVSSLITILTILMNITGILQIVYSTWWTWILTNRNTFRNVALEQLFVCWSTSPRLSNMKMISNFPSFSWSLQNVIVVGLVDRL